MAYDFSLQNYLNRRGEFYKEALKEACKNIRRKGAYLIPNFRNLQDGRIQFTLGFSDDKPFNPSDLNFKRLSSTLQHWYLGNPIYHASSDKILHFSHVKYNIISGSIDLRHDLNHDGRIEIVRYYGNDSNTLSTIPDNEPAEITSLGDFFYGSTSPYQLEYNENDNSWSYFINPERHMIFQVLDSPDYVVGNDGSETFNDKVYFNENDIKSFHLEIRYFDNTTNGYRRKRLGTVSAQTIYDFVTNLDFVNESEDEYLINGPLPVTIGATIEEHLAFRYAIMQAVNTQDNEPFIENKIRTFELLMSNLKSKIIQSLNNIIDYYAIYYYFDGATLTSFIDMTQSSSAGFGGGKMRADPPWEVEYAWFGNLILGVSIGLSPSRYFISESIDEMRDKGYHITNVPWDKDIFNDGTVSKSSAFYYGSEIIYGKHFTNGNLDRRNKPKNPSRPEHPAMDDKMYKYGGSRQKQKGERNFRNDSTGVRLNHRNPKSRKDAGKVMGVALYSDGFEGAAGGSKLSATDFTNYMLNHFELTTDGFGQYIEELHDQYQIKTDQEWCHLYGHGDGGNEVYGNFISGSKHCNTEQLAIETGQRVDGHRGLTAKITGYLRFAGFGEKDWPLGNWVRYKLCHESSGVKRKIFDHIFHAQSQSFNYHEFQILETSVRRVIAFSTNTIEDYSAYITQQYREELRLMHPDNKSIIRRLLGRNDEFDLTQLEYKYDQLMVLSNAVNMKRLNLILH